MILIIMAVLFVVVGILLLWQPAWPFKSSSQQAVQRVTQATSKVIETTKETVEKAGERLSGERPSPRIRPELAAQFKEWLSQAELERRMPLYKALPADAADFTAWLLELGDKDLGDFSQELAVFCQGQGFDLAWLADAQVPGEMKYAVEEAIGLYCLAAWKSHNLLPLSTYRAWLADPENPKNNAFAQRLYSRLVESGMATARSDMLWAPEKERHAFIVQSMQTVAAQDPKSFVALLKAAMVVEAEPSAEASPA
jgi:hypothetical protein